MNIFFVIPAYDEQGNLSELIDRILSQRDAISAPIAIHFVLQGDRQSLSIIRKKAKTTSVPITASYFPHPLGIGAAYRKGYACIPPLATHIITMDADLNHDPADIPSLISHMKRTHADMVIGSRFAKGGSFGETRRWKKIVSRSINMIFTTILRLPVHDISSGFRLIHADIARKLLPRLKEDGYPAYMEFVLLAYKEGARISEIPITYTPRTWGTSKLTIQNTLAHYLHFLPRILYDPYKRNTM